MHVTIILASYNRPEKLRKCILQIKKILNKDISLVVMDLFDPPKVSATNIKKIHRTNITYINFPSKNKSKALNEGIRRSRGDIIVFTDDDCIVSLNWIKVITSMFVKHPEVHCITGDVLPYKNIPVSNCPPTIHKKLTLFKKPTYHSHIGYGNNLAIRREVINSVVGFREWLGPGTHVHSCEDGDLITRLLQQGYMVLHDPKVIVFHNKNLISITDKINQNISYFSGEIACYMYYSLSGLPFAKKIIASAMKEIINDGKLYIKTFNRKQKGITPHMLFFKKIIAAVIGFYTGIKEYYKEKLTGIRL